MSALTSSVIDSNEAPVMVLFGGDPHRRHEVLELVRGLGDITAYGTLSEEEGMALLATLPRVDLVLIGGRYSEEQRAGIRAHVRAKMPGTRLTEPGWSYPYDNSTIAADILSKLGRSESGDGQQ